jgi:hypothetical protein
MSICGLVCGVVVLYDGFFWSDWFWSDWFLYGRDISFWLLHSSD